MRSRMCATNYGAENSPSLEAIPSRKLHILEEIYESQHAQKMSEISHEILESKKDAHNVVQNAPSYIEI